MPSLVDYQLWRSVLIGVSVWKARCDNKLILGASLVLTVVLGIEHVHVYTWVAVSTYELSWMFSTNQHKLTIPNRSWHPLVDLCVVAKSMDFQFRFLLCKTRKSLQYTDSAVIVLCYIGGLPVATHSDCSSRSTEHCNHESTIVAGGAELTLYWIVRAISSAHFLWQLRDFGKRH